MWNEWLARTLRPRRAEESEPATESRAARPFTVLPDLECDGMHSGADEFRSAMHRTEADNSAA